MVKRRSKKRKKKAYKAIAKGDEPPDPITTGLIIAGVGTAGALGLGITQAVQSRRQALPEVEEPPSILAGESTELKPGEKVNAINTSPQGVLEEPNTGRRTLLGG